MSPIFKIIPITRVAGGAQVIQWRKWKALRTNPRNTTYTNETKLKKELQ
jgi:hypothetical protein